MFPHQSPVSEAVSCDGEEKGDPGEIYCDGGSRTAPGCVILVPLSPAWE